MSGNEHVPVLLGPVLEGLYIKKDGCYVDGTFGRGGHSGEILKHLNSDGIDLLLARIADLCGRRGGGPERKKDPAEGDYPGSEPSREPSS